MKRPKSPHYLTLQERLAKFSTPSPTGCILWTGMVVKGYGVMSWKNKPQKAHRLAWEAANGQAPAEMHVCHRCDVPLCVNPDHLWLGTNQENTADKVSKKRQARGDALSRATIESTPRGENHPHAKLTADKVLSIRTDARTHRQAAAHYGVSTALISAIKNRKVWNHI